MALASRFWVFWIKNTIRNVTMVVPVLITSCQVSEYPNIGPVTAQTAMMSNARMNAHGLPTAAEAAAENFRNTSCIRCAFPQRATASRALQQHEPGKLPSRLQPVTEL